METSVFRIKTPVFEGPLELLLDLIEGRKLLISDVSLSSVTDDYIEYIKQIEYFPMGEAAQFIYVAATLLLLKSKSLLPVLTLTEEETESIEDLERRLRLYKYFQGLGKKIQEIFGVRIIFEKSYTKVTDPVFSPPKEFTPFTAHASVMEAIRKLPKKTFTPKVSVKKAISLDETISSLTDRIRQSLKMTFHEFARHGKAERVDVIVSFLAVLELVKREVINVRQEIHFEDIHMESNEPGVPRY